MKQIMENLTRQQSDIAALAQQLRAVIEAQVDLRDQMEALRRRATLLRAEMDAKLADQSRKMSRSNTAPGDERS